MAPVAGPPAGAENRSKWPVATDSSTCADMPGMLALAGAVSAPPELPVAGASVILPRLSLRQPLPGRRLGVSGYENNQRQDRDRQARLVRRRRQRQDARPSRHRARAPPARQAQARLHPARRHRRLHRRDQRREDRRHRQQAATTRCTTGSPATSATSRPSRLEQAARARTRSASIEIAVKGMLPKNPLGRAMYTKLKVFAGAEASARRPAAASRSEI